MPPPELSPPFATIVYDMIAFQSATTFWLTKRLAMARPPPSRLKIELAVSFWFSLIESQVCGRYRKSKLLCRFRPSREVDFAT
jgi:hypothetical protein